MNLRLIKVWDDIRHSYWFVPGLMAVGSMVLATLTITLDGQVQSEWYRQDVLERFERVVETEADH